jgi:hypothetical protein
LKQLNWANAFVFCRQFGLDFVSLESQDEMDNFLNIVNNAPANHVDHHQFIGATQIGTPSNWYWIATGRNVNHTIKWGTGEPNGLAVGENCMTISKYNTAYFYNDALCYGASHVFRFICEYLEEN